MKQFPKFKKVFSLALSCIMLFSFSTTSFAATTSNNGEIESLDSTVDYYVRGSYTVEIPSYIDITDIGSSLYLSECNIPDDCYIEVSLLSIPSDGIFTLTHTTDSSQTIEVQLSGHKGTVTPSQPYIAKFTNGSLTSTQISGTIVGSNTNPKAGHYQGNVTYYFYMYQG